MRGGGLLRKNEWRQIDLPGYTNEFLVTLSNLSFDNTYSIFATAWDKSGKVKKTETLRFKPSEISEFLTDNAGEAPKLKSADVIQVTVGAITFALIKIETDKLVKVKIDYGISEKLGLVLAVDQFRREHTLTLRSLDMKKTYYYKVTLFDPFDNKVTSEIFQFSPSKAFQKVSAADEIIDEFVMQPVKVVKVVKRGEYVSKSNMDNSLRQKREIAVVISANHQVRANINFTEVDLEKEGDSKKDMRHGEFGLKSKKETGIDVCIGCHFQGASHPVGMTAKGETIIPKSLPTAEGGIMTCATCHAPHGTRFEYLARIDFSKELCTMCHKGKFF
jgi:predicted CXXCH cytochrome family protein